MKEELYKGVTRQLKKYPLPLNPLTKKVFISDFAHYVLNRLNPDLFGISRGGSIYLAKIISWVWSQKDVDLAKIWFPEEGKYRQDPNNTFK